MFPFFEFNNIYLYSFDMDWGFSYFLQILFITFILIIIMELTNGKLFQSYITFRSIFNLKIEKNRVIEWTDI